MSVNPENFNPFGDPVDSDFSVDLAEVQSNNVPVGTYLARVKDVTKAHSQAGNPQWRWDFALVGGEYDGRTLPVFTALTPAALWKVAEVLEALGIGQAGQQVRFTKGDVINKLATVVLEEDTYNGRTRTIIKRVNAPPQGAGSRWQDPAIPR